MSGIQSINIKVDAAGMRIDIVFGGQAPQVAIFESGTSSDPPSAEVPRSPGSSTMLPELPKSVLEGTIAAHDKAKLRSRWTYRNENPPPPEEEPPPSEEEPPPPEEEEPPPPEEKPSLSSAVAYPALHKLVHADELPVATDKPPVAKKKRNKKNKAPVKLPLDLHKRRHYYKLPGTKLFAPLPPELAAAQELEDQELDARRAAYIADVTKRDQSQPTSSPGPFRYATREEARLARLESNRKSRIKMKAKRKAEKLAELASRPPSQPQDIQAIIDAAFKAAGIERPPLSVSP
jgi:hypothetical protein